MSKQSATVAKPANKPAQTVAQQNKAQAVAAIKYALEANTGRPMAGNALKAHTAAFLVLSGMYEGKPASIAQARVVLGDTAISYHTKRGNFERAVDGLRLTEKGEMFFAIRGAIMESVEGYIDVLTTGNIDAKGIQKINHPSFIVRIG